MGSGPDINHFGLTVADKLSAAHGRPAGFDYLRLLLSLSIIVIHTVDVCYGPAASIEAWESGFRPVMRAVLPMFFALSGFLVAGSFVRCRTMVRFFGLRAIRIYPALIVEVLLSAFILGTVLTVLPLTEYFQDAKFHVYLLNAVGDPHYELPGLFVDNPNPGLVNRQLWTVPYELGCYVSIAVLAILGGAKRHWLAPVATVGLSVVYYAATLYRSGGQISATVGPFSGPLLVITFLAGVSIYLYRSRLPLNHGLGIFVGMLGFALGGWSALGAFLAPIPLAYFTVYLGTLDPPRFAVVRHADLSYGLFLYGYPIQQTIASIGGWARIGWVNLSASVLVTLVVAFISWNLVEKPALELRHWLKAWEDRRIARPSSV